VLKTGLPVIPVIFLIVITVCLAYSALQNNAHDFTVDQCSDCHAVTPVKGKRETMRMTTSIEMLCRRCHKKNNDPLSHPVEMIPENIMPPADLPLSWEGKMTCATCHDIHALPQPGVDGGSYYLRRAVTGRAFCDACHSVNPRAQEKGHANDLKMAHTKYEEGSSGSIDRVSMTCLSCHDGTMAAKGNVKAGIFTHGVAISSPRYDDKGSHPIGVKYREAMRRGGLLRPKELLNPKIRLISGKVGCASCHDIYSKLPNMVVLEGDSLCKECHGNI